MYYMITWFGKSATQHSGAWALNAQNGAKAMKYVVETLKSKWWSGQLEKGATTGRLHIQAMIETNYSLQDLIDIAKDRGWDWHAEPIEDIEEGALYTSKKDTRIDGPWQKEERTRMDFEEYYTKRMWEDELEGHLKKGKVVLIVDQKGGAEKTSRALS